MRLALEEGRVIGCLIEKQLTTPQQYPLTLNALVSACNQASNRDPVVSYEPGTVTRALRSLKDAGLVHFVYPSHGRSVIRYRQALDEMLGLDEGRSALIAVLLLRGPQTAGELRARTERMTTFESISTVDAELGALSEREEPLVVQLRRRPGQKEERWAQLLAPEGLTPADADSEAETGWAVDDIEDRHTWTAGAIGGLDSGQPTGDRLAGLADEVALLRAEVATLRATVEELRRPSL